MPEELKPCPNVCCQSDPTMRMKRGKVPLFVVICVNCGWSAPEAKPTREDAVVSWNTRPVSELERLAREVVKISRSLDRTDLNVSIDAMADNLAESKQKEKQE